ncbi:MAG: polysaccharide biosynthesis/export family protein [bacterium]|nr:polysaccharide biosynthesis/export family protein [bacterium]
MRYSRSGFALAILFAATAASAQQTISPGDQLNVQVYGQQALSENVTVLPDGTVQYPLVGNVRVGGLTVNAATSLFAARLAKYVRDPYVTIAIAQLGKPSVLVLGNVKSPGKYDLRSGARLTDAIAAAGGLAVVDGPLPDARVSDGNDARTVSLQRLLQQGDLSQDVSLAEGDVVYVPGPVLMDVVVTGAVDHPGDIQVSEGDRLSMAIAKAGNSAGANADLNHVRVLRTEADGHTKQFTVDLYRALEHGDEGADITLHKGDVVFVPQARRHTDAFASPLLYLLGRLFIP